MTRFGDKSAMAPPPARRARRAPPPRGPAHLLALSGRLRRDIAEMSRACAELEPEAQAAEEARRQRDAAIAGIRAATEEARAWAAKQAQY